MKKLILLSIVLMSCDKNYNCKCTTLNKQASQTTTDSYIINANKKAIAEEKCNEGDRDSQSFYTDCVITN